MKEFLHKVSLPCKPLTIVLGPIIGLLMLAGVANAATDISQGILDRRLTGHYSNITLRELLVQIENSSQVKFVYSEDFVQLNEKLTLHAENEKLGDVLKKILPPLRIKYEIVKDRIVLRKEKDLKTKAIILPLPADDQSEKFGVMVSGRVTDTDGSTIPGVNIIVKNTTIGTATDAQGKYSIEVPDAEAVLIFSFIGFVTQEVKVGSQNKVDVVLQPDVQKLSEVVVVGYGTQQKKDLTGSISTVSKNEIRALPVTSVDQALSGRAAGVQVTTASAAPGGAVSVRIRGGNSIGAGTEPLYVIDGIPVYSDNSTYRPGGTAELGQSANALSSINPNDIESIEILKDASATAIYGSRGANGVVLITTKRGKAGGAVIDFEVYHGVQQVTRKIDLMNAREYANLYNTIIANDNTPDANQTPMTEAFVNSLGEGTDWQEELFRTAPISNYQATVSGGTDKSRYAISGNYFKQLGVIPNSDFDRYSTRLNLDSEISSRFRVGNNLTISYTSNNEILGENGGNERQGPVYNALHAPPVVPVKTRDGSYVEIQSYGRDSLGFASPTLPGLNNPFNISEKIENRVTSTRILGNIFAEYDVMKNLKFRVSVGGDMSTAKRQNYFPASISTFATARGRGTLAYSQVYNWLNENLLTYSKTFNDIHNLNVTALFSIQEQRVEKSQITNSNFPNDITGANNIQAGATREVSSNVSSRWGMVSYMIRANYGFADRYLLTFAARMDGSSRFGPENKYGLFPSAAIGWRVSEENFMKSLTFISDLKLRGSYGLTGNSEIGDYDYLPEIVTNQVSNYVFNGVEAIGYAPNRLSNNDLKWEKTRQLDIGVDLGLFGDRITLVADYYIKTTNDLLVSIDIPTVSGYSASRQNVGSLENKGFEFALVTRNVEREFKWTTSANISFNRNKILDLGGASFIEVTLPNAFFATNFYRQVLMPGLSVGNFYGMRVEKLWGSAQEITDADAADGNPATLYQAANRMPGDRKYADVDGDGVINKGLNKDKVIIGNSVPDFIYGVSNTFSYKGIDLSIFIQGSYGNDVLNLTRFKGENDLSGRENKPARVANFWTPENQNTLISRPGRDQEREVVDLYVEDGSFLRIKNINLGYTFPVSKWTSVVRKAKIYLSVQNLHTFTRYSGFDPEVNAYGQSTLLQGIDVNSYPNTRMFLLGVNLGL